MFVLKKHRKKRGISLNDFASILSIDPGNLSKIESGKLKASVDVLIAYHLLLEIPLKELLKINYLHVVANCTENASVLREKLLDQMISPEPNQRLVLLDKLIDRLIELQEAYEK